MKKRPVIGTRRHFARKEIESDSDDEDDIFLAGERKKYLQNQSYERRKQKNEHGNNLTLQEELLRHEAYEKNEEIANENDVDQVNLMKYFVHMDNISPVTTNGSLKESLRKYSSIIAVNIFSETGDLKKGIAIFQDLSDAEQAVQYLSNCKIDGRLISATITNHPKRLPNAEHLESSTKTKDESQDKDKLTKLDRAKLEWLIQGLNCEKGSIGNLLCFAAEHVNNHVEITDAFLKEFFNDQPTDDTKVYDDDYINERGEKKLSLIYLMNDILFNGISGTSLVWRYRFSFEPHVERLLDDLYLFSKRLGGRIKEDIFCKKVVKVIEVWKTWIAFQEETLERAWRNFSGNTPQSPQINSAALKVETKNSWTAISEETEGLQDDEEYNGIPVDVNELLNVEFISQIPMSTETSSSSSPQPTEERKAKFKPSFTQGTFVSKRMRMHAEDLF
ncbi:U2-associated protein [Schizosaccharomyces pombe]